jgi:hypothetical protein
VPLLCNILLNKKSIEMIKIKAAWNLSDLLHLDNHGKSAVVAMEEFVHH